MNDIVAPLLRKYTDQYIEGIDAKQLQVSLFGGDLQLNSLQLKRSALAGLNLPLDVVRGTLGSLYVKVKLSTRTVEVSLKDVLLVARPKSYGLQHRYVRFTAKKLRDPGCSKMRLGAIQCLDDKGQVIPVRSVAPQSKTGGTVSEAWLRKALGEDGRWTGDGPAWEYDVSVPVVMDLGQERTDIRGYRIRTPLDGTSQSDPVEWVLEGSITGTEAGPWQPLHRFANDILSASNVIHGMRVMAQPSPSTPPALGTVVQIRRNREMKVHSICVRFDKEEGSAFADPIDIAATDWNSAVIRADDAQEHMTVRVKPTLSAEKALVGSVASVARGRGGVSEVHVFFDQGQEGAPKGVVKIPAREFDMPASKAVHVRAMCGGLRTARGQWAVFRPGTGESSAEDAKKAAEAKLEEVRAALSAAEQAEKELVQAAQQGPGSGSFVERLTEQVISNIKIKVENIHVRLEDDMTNPAPRTWFGRRAGASGPPQRLQSHTAALASDFEEFAESESGPWIRRAALPSRQHVYALGVCFESLEVRSVDERGDPTDAVDPAKPIGHKVAKLTGLGLYLDHGYHCDLMSHTIADLRQWKAWMVEGTVRQRDLSTSTPRDHTWIFRPLDLDVKLAMLTRVGKMDSGEKRPFHDCSVRCGAVGLALSRAQFLSVLGFLQFNMEFSKRVKYFPHRPVVPLSRKTSAEGDPRSWWVYMVRCCVRTIRDQRPVQTKTVAGKLKVETEYKEMFKLLQRKPWQEELVAGSKKEDLAQRTLDQYDLHLPMLELRGFRKAAASELDSAEKRWAKYEADKASRMREKQSQQSWAAWWRGEKAVHDSETEEMERQARLEIAEFAGIEEGEEAVDTVELSKAKGRDYVQDRVSMSVQEVYVRLDSDDGAALTQLTQREVLFGLSMRAANTEVSLVLGDIDVLSELGNHGVRKQILGVARGDDSPTFETPCGTEAGSDMLYDAQEPEEQSFFALQFSSPPLDGRADQVLQLKMRQTEVWFSPTWLSHVLSFWRVPQSIRLGSLEAAVSVALSGSVGAASRQLQLAIEDRTQIELDVSLAAPRLWIVDNEHLENTTGLLLDLGSLDVKSEVDADKKKRIRGDAGAIREEDYFDKYCMNLSGVSLWLVQVWGKRGVKRVPLLHDIGMRLDLETCLTPDDVRFPNVRMNGRVPPHSLRLSPGSVQDLLRSVTVLLTWLANPTGASDQGSGQAADDAAGWAGDVEVETPTRFTRVGSEDAQEPGEWRKHSAVFHADSSKLVLSDPGANAPVVVRLGVRTWLKKVDDHIVIMLPQEYDGDGEVKANVEIALRASQRTEELFAAMRASVRSIREWREAREAERQRKLAEDRAHGVGSVSEEGPKMNREQVLVQCNIQVDELALILSESDGSEGRGVLDVGIRNLKLSAQVRPNDLNAEMEMKELSCKDLLRESEDKTFLGLVGREEGTTVHYNKVDAGLQTISVRCHELRFDMERRTLPTILGHLMRYLPAFTDLIDAAVAYGEAPLQDVASQNSEGVSVAATMDTLNAWFRNAGNLMFCCTASESEVKFSTSPEKMSVVAQLGDLSFEDRSPWNEKFTKIISCREEEAASSVNVEYTQLLQARPPAPGQPFFSAFCKAHVGRSRIVYLQRVIDQLVRYFDAGYLLGKMPTEQVDAAAAYASDVAEAARKMARDAAAQRATALTLMQLNVFVEEPALVLPYSSEGSEMIGRCTDHAELILGQVRLNTDVKQMGSAWMEDFQLSVDKTSLILRDATIAGRPIISSSCSVKAERAVVNPGDKLPTFAVFGTVGLDVRLSKQQLDRAMLVLSTNVCNGSDSRLEVVEADGVGEREAADGGAQGPRGAAPNDGLVKTDLLLKLEFEHVNITLDRAFNLGELQREAEKGGLLWRGVPQEELAALLARRGAVTELDLAGFRLQGLSVSHEMKDSGLQTSVVRLSSVAMEDLRPSGPVSSLRRLLSFGGSTEAGREGKRGSGAAPLVSSKISAEGLTAAIAIPNAVFICVPEFVCEMAAFFIPSESADDPEAAAVSGLVRRAEDAGDLVIGEEAYHLLTSDLILGPLHRLVVDRPSGDDVPGDARRRRVVLDGGKLHCIFLTGDCNCDRGQTLPADALRACIIVHPDVELVVKNATVYSDRTVNDYVFPGSVFTFESCRVRSREEAATAPPAEAAAAAADNIRIFVTMHDGLRVLVPENAAAEDSRLLVTTVAGHLYMNTGGADRRAVNLPSQAVRQWLMTKSPPSSGRSRAPLATSLSVVAMSASRQPRDAIEEWGALPLGCEGGFLTIGQVEHGTAAARAAMRATFPLSGTRIVRVGGVALPFGNSCSAKSVAEALSSALDSCGDDVTVEFETAAAMQVELPSLSIQSTTVWHLYTHGAVLHHVLGPAKVKLEAFRECHAGSQSLRCRVNGSNLGVRVCYTDVRAVVQAWQRLGPITTRRAPASHTENELLQHSRTLKAVAAPAAAPGWTSVHATVRLSPGAQAFHVLLVDDQEGYDQELLRFDLMSSDREPDLAVSLKASSHEEWGSHFHTKVTFGVALSYFNPALAEWEPVLERTSMTAQASSVPTGHRDAPSVMLVQMRSAAQKEGLFVNFSGHALARLAALSASWEEDLRRDRCLTKDMVHGSKYVVRNFTGFKLDLMGHFSDASIRKTEQLAGSDALSVHCASAADDDEEEVPRKIRQVDSQPFYFNLEHVDQSELPCVGLSLMGGIRDLVLISSGQYRRQLVDIPSEMVKQHALQDRMIHAEVCEVKGQITMTLSSRFMVRNYTSTELELRLRRSRGADAFEAVIPAMPLDEHGDPIPGMERTSEVGVPLWLLPEQRDDDLFLEVRPVPQAGRRPRSWSVAEDEPRFSVVNAKRADGSLRCAVAGARDASASFKLVYRRVAEWCSAARGAKAVRREVIELRAPMILENLLPCPITISWADGGSKPAGMSWQPQGTAAIQPGQHHVVHNARPASNVHCSVRVHSPDQFDDRRSASDFFMLHLFKGDRDSSTKFSLTDSTNREVLFLLQCKVKSARRALLEVSVYVPYWVVNVSPYRTLVVEQEEQGARDKGALRIGRATRTAADAPSPSALLYSPDLDAKQSVQLRVRVEDGHRRSTNSAWFSPVTVDVPGAVSCGMDQRQHTLGVNIELAPGRFGGTKIVKLMPRWKFRNMTEHALKFHRHTAGEMLRLQPREENEIDAGSSEELRRAAGLQDGQLEPLCLSVADAAGKDAWSNPFSINDEGTQFRAAGDHTFEVRVVQKGAMVHVVFQAPTRPPLRIINHTFVEAHVEAVGSENYHGRAVSVPGMGRADFYPEHRTGGGVAELRVVAGNLDTTLECVCGSDSKSSRCEVEAGIELGNDSLLCVIRPTSSNRRANVDGDSANSLEADCPRRGKQAAGSAEVLMYPGVNLLDLAPLPGKTSARTKKLSVVSGVRTLDEARRGAPQAILSCRHDRSDVFARWSAETRTLELLQGALQFPIAALKGASLSDSPPPGTTCALFVHRDAAAPRGLGVYLDFTLRTTIGVSLIHATETQRQEIAFLSLTTHPDEEQSVTRGVELNVIMHGQSLGVDLKVRHIQLDNQMVDPLYPVAVCTDVGSMASEGERRRAGGDQHGRPAALAVSICDFSAREGAMVTMASCDFLLQTLQINIDDNFLFSLLDYVLQLAPAATTDQAQLYAAIVKKPEFDPQADGTSSSPQMYAGMLRVQPIRLVITFSADDLGSRLPAIATIVGACLHIDSGVLSLNMFQLSPASGSQADIVNVITGHYTSQVLRSLYKLVFALEMIGNPVGLFGNIGRGINDLLYEPLYGATQGPSEFVQGIRGGAGSAGRHFLYGGLTAVAGLANFSKQLTSKLTFDAEHTRTQRERQKRRPDGVAQGLQQGAEAIGGGVVSAVTGVYTKPRAAGQQEGRMSLAWAGGLVRGIVGVPTTVLSGLLEGVGNIVDGARGLVAGSRAQRVRPPRAFPRGALREYDARGRFQASARSLASECGFGADCLQLAAQGPQPAAQAGAEEVCILTDRRLIVAVAGAGARRRCDFFSDDGDILVDCVRLQSEHEMVISHIGMPDLQVTTADPDDTEALLVALKWLLPGVRLELGDNFPHLCGPRTGRAEVYESQSRAPEEQFGLQGPASWTDAAGMQRPAAGSDETQPPRGCVWLEDWRMCADQPTDPDGWLYGADFAAAASPRQGAGSLVRRRRWVRAYCPVELLTEGASTRVRPLERSC